MSSEYDQGSKVLNVGEFLLEYLRLEEVDILFGLPGAALLEFLNTVRMNDKEFPFVVARQETGATYIADGYARVSGKLGVVVVTSGPGATNALTAAMNANSMSSSVLVLTGEVATDKFGRGAFQSGVDSGLNMKNVYSNSVAYSEIFTSPRNFKALFEQALRDCLSIPHRTVHLSLPENLMGLPIGKDAVAPKHTASYRAVPNAANPNDVEDTLSALMAAELPVIYLGNGCRRIFLPTTSMTQEEALATDKRRQDFIEMVERLGIPIVTSGDGKGIFPESHDLSLHNYGLGGSPWPGAYIDAQNTSLTYDAMVVLGSSLNEKNTLGPSRDDDGTTSVRPVGWSPQLIPQGPFIHVDANQRVIGRGYDITKGIVAELSVFIDLMIERSKAYTFVENHRQMRLEYIKSIKDTVAYPKEALEDIIVKIANDEVAKFANGGPAHLFIDATKAARSSLIHMTIDPPLQFHNSLVQAPIGMGIGGGIGGKFADPDAPVVVVCGDGGLMMQGSEISTAFYHKLGVVFLVFYNNLLGTVVIEEEEQFGHEPQFAEFFELGQPDLVKFSEGLGAYAEGIGPKFATPTGSPLSPAVEEAMVKQMRERFPILLQQAKDEKRPQVLVVRIPLVDA